MKDKSFGIALPCVAFIVQKNDASQPLVFDRVGFVLGAAKAYNPSFPFKLHCPNLLAQLFAGRLREPLTACQKKAEVRGRLAVSGSGRRPALTLAVVFVLTLLPQAFFFQLKTKKGTAVTRNGWTAKGRKCKWPFVRLLNMRCTLISIHLSR